MRYSNDLDFCRLSVTKHRGGYDMITHELVSKIQRELFKAQDDGFPFDPYRTIADAIYRVSKSDDMCPLRLAVQHYLSFYKERDEWFNQCKFKKLAIGGVNYTFGDAEWTNEHFGLPEDSVMPELAHEIASAANIFLRYFDTEKGVPRIRKNWTVAVVDSADKEYALYGVHWFLRPDDHPMMGNRYPIEAFEKGRSLIINIANYMWYLKSFSDDWLPECFDYTSEMFGEANEDGTFKSVKAKVPASTSA